jgi:hypothetical protein
MWYAAANRVVDVRTTGPFTELVEVLWIAAALHVPARGGHERMGSNRTQVLDLGSHIGH